MKRQTLSFRALIERVLPVDALPAVERVRVRRALEGGSNAEVEEAAFTALEGLVRLGILDPLPDRSEDGERVFRFQRRDSHEVFAVRVAAPGLPAGITALPRGLALLRGACSAERVRRLARIDGALLGGDDRLSPGPAALIEHVVADARDLLDCDSVAFFPSVPAAEATGAYAPPAGEVELFAPWSRATVIERDLVLSCPHVAAVPELADRPLPPHARSAAAVRVRGRDAAFAGVLEARSASEGHFTPARLALLALLAENFAALVDRAQRLERLVFVDPLTGASNRVHFHQALANELARARRDQASMALVIGDIDDFKRFNTIYGYEGGNAVLKQVARLLKRAVRPFDSVARWGGEEFAVLLSADVSRDDAAAIVERLRTSIAEREHRVPGLDGQEHRVHVTMSFGAALFPDDGQTADELWRHANLALLEAKRPPKGKVVFWEKPREDGPAPPSS
jgi:diguanylate cyclase (GGDEF)-like protein